MTTQLGIGKIKLFAVSAVCSLSYSFKNYLVHGASTAPWIILTLGGMPRLHHHACTYCTLPSVSGVTFSDEINYFLKAE